MKYRSIAPVLLAATLASCTSSEPPTPPLYTPPAQTLWAADHLRQAPARLVYVADFLDNDVVIYKQRGHNQQPIGTLTDKITFPVAVSVDTNRNLWVANEYSELQSTILRFPEGSTTPDKVLLDPNWNIETVWVGPDGAVYAVNIGYSANSEIIKYPPGKTTSKVITDPHMTSFTTAIVGDTHGNLFAAGFPNSGSGGEVDERPAGSTRWHNTGIPLSEPGGLAIDGSGNLVVTDIGYDLIETFQPGQTKPSNTIECTTQCASVAFNHTGDRIWVDEFNDDNGSIEERDYPSGTLIDNLPQPQDSSPDSVAVTPNLPL